MGRQHPADDPRALHPRATITKDNGGEDADGLTHANIDAATCSISEAQIEFPEPADKAWDYETPWADAADHWYDTGPTDANDATWFRPSFLHELLHAFAFEHVTDQYSFMTHRSPGGFPWANRLDDQAARPLPSEIGVLRYAYGDTAVSYDVSLLNTWYGPPQPGDDAGSQVDLCTPSTGNVWSTMLETGACGNNNAAEGATDLCLGDTLLHALSLANASTESVHATARLWFSTDETWDAGDIRSATKLTKDVNAETSAPWAAAWEVPALNLGVDYYPIVRVTSEHVLSDGTTDAKSERTDLDPVAHPGARRRR